MGRNDTPAAASYSAAASCSAVPRSAAADFRAARRRRSSCRSFDRINPYRSSENRILDILSCFSPPFIVSSGFLLLPLYSPCPSFARAQRIFPAFPCAPSAPCPAAYLLAKSALFSVHCKYYHHNNRTTVNGRQNSVKATGIVRRIDDLGRVVIPKEVRRTLRIREGDPAADIVDSGRTVLLRDERADRENGLEVIHNGTAQWELRRFAERMRHGLPAVEKPFSRTLRHTLQRNLTVISVIFMRSFGN